MIFDPLAICEALNAEHVDYVVLGGFAAVVHGSSLPTEDIDVLPDRAEENLVRLSTALRRVGAMIRTEGEPVRAPLDAGFLKTMPHMLNLVTDFGDVALIFTPTGPQKDFADWNSHAF